MREHKYRVWDAEYSQMIYEFDDGYHIDMQDGSLTVGFYDPNGGDYYELELLQCTTIKDKNGKEIYFNDILRFSDKWEWYKGQYGIKMRFANKEEHKKLREEYEAKPYEERVVDCIEDYDWLLSSEIQQYWEVIGNIHENPELL